MTSIFLLIMRTFWCAVHKVAFLSTGLLSIYLGVIYATHGEWPLFGACVGMAVSAMLVAFLRHQTYTIQD
jgi:hypothetical protein